jgi:hypothetical protein
LIYNCPFSLKAILPNVICGASGFPRTGGIAK